MAQPTTAALQAPAPYVPSNRTKTIYAVAIFLGVILFGAGLATDQTRTWFSFLTSYMFFTNLALGGLFFSAIHHVSKAGWSVNVRRLAEAMTSYLPIAAIGALPLLLGARQLYIWLDPSVVQNDPILLGKSAYLNWPFFIIRLVIFFGAWLLFRRSLVGNSLKQDKDGDPRHTIRNVAVSVGFIVVFALSYSLFTVDLLMSLQPHWFSTIWGVYNFAGLFQSTLAVLAIIIVAVMNKGIARGLITTDHLHDVVKYLKAFCIFYAYIGFSQFLLIWYANLPEETIFYLARSQGPWMIATLSLLVFKFIVPFILLLPRAAKRTPAHVVLVSVLVLIMQYIDIHWMVYPNLTKEPYHGQFLFSWQEIGTFLMFGGLFMWSVTTFLSKNPIIPLRDPREEESLAHHVTY